VKKGGELLKAVEGTAKAETSEALVKDNNLKVDELLVVYRLRTAVQDRDFFFGYNLNITGHIIHGVFVPQLSEAKNGVNKRAPVKPPCSFDGLYTVDCRAEVNVLNSWLSNIGFAVSVDDNADSAITLFIINDTGSIDWLDRPLAAGFVVEFFKPLPVPILAAPIAALVILPVIAAATAAALAAAWIVLGQRAQDYAGASFDKFEVSQGIGGHSSPLYDDLGLEVTSALYATPHGKS